MAIEQIKTLLGISSGDTSRNALLSEIESLTSERLCHLLGDVESVPDGLSYIVTEVSVSRFNRIGSEGLSSHTVEGETMSWDAGNDDFSPYADDIEEYIASQENAKKGKVRFL